LKSQLAVLRKTVGDTGADHPKCEVIVQEFWDYDDDRTGHDGRSNFLAPPARIFQPAGQDTLGDPGQRLPSAPPVPYQ
jgi:hypothetical protein